MISLSITDKKAFISRLLAGEAFDHFLAAEAVITTFNTFIVDGRIKKDFYTEEELSQNGLSERNYSYWKEIKNVCFELIKGKKTPLGFKFVFQLADYNIEKLLHQNELPFQKHDINGLVLTVKYDGTKLTAVTGTSMKLFTMDRRLEQVWDENVRKFFYQQGIACEDCLAN